MGQEDRNFTVMVRYTFVFGMGLARAAMGQGQVLDPVLITALPAHLNEASALLFHQHQPWIALDSGNPNTLFRVDTQSGQVLQEVVLTNAANVDWEALAMDDTWVYVGDVGNNAGHRTDLCIYRFPIQALAEGSEEVVVDTIRFHYADQWDHTPAPDATNWDAEALLAMGDSLFLFTKNWLNGRTHLYALPATPGVHTAVRRAEFDTQGLITDAAYDPTTGGICLLGHSANDMAPFIWLLNGYTGHHFFGGACQRYPLNLVALQAEAIAFSEPFSLWMANERTAAREAALWIIPWPMAVDEHSSAKALYAYPIPAGYEVHVEGARGAHQARVLGLNGTLIATVPIRSDGTIPLPALTQGAYLLEVMVDGRPGRIPLVVSY